jgi:hypothetical protein
MEANCVGRFLRVSDARIRHCGNPWRCSGLQPQANSGIRIAEFVALPNTAKKGQSLLCPRAMSIIIESRLPEHHSSEQRNESTKVGRQHDSDKKRLGNRRMGLQAKQAHNRRPIPNQQSEGLLKLQRPDGLYLDRMKEETKAVSDEKETPDEAGETPEKRARPRNERP